MRWLFAAVLLVCSLPGCTRPSPTKPPVVPQVWVINGLDVPLKVTVAGESVTILGRSEESLATTAYDLQFVATTTDGREIDRAQVFRALDHKIAYNILGAAPLLYGKETYVPESRKDIPVVGDGGGSTEYLEKIVNREGFDFFFEPAPETVKVAKSERDELWKYTVRVNGGWKDTVKFLEAEERHVEAREFADRIAEVQRSDNATRQPVQKVPERIRKQEKPVTAATMPLLWQEQSKDRRARVEQRPAGKGTCNTSCAIGSSAVWTVNECLGNNGPLRFISNDCTRLVVVRVAGEGSWEYSPVVFIYSNGQLDRTMTAAEFVTGESAIRAIDDSTFTWLTGGASLSDDGGSIEFKTTDGRPHRISLR